MGAYDYPLRIQTELAVERVFEGRVRTSRMEGQRSALCLSLLALPGQRHSFTLKTLDGLEQASDAVAAAIPIIEAAAPEDSLEYLVLRSEHPDYFSLGGDLEHFRGCIASGDREALLRYSLRCLDLMYGWATRWNGRLTTVALVQGRALGGGFETALSADYLVAEEQSTFSFPEILFGLFPCTGGMGLLARRVGVHQAERMMTNGRIYTAAELHEMGVVDELCERGTGLAAVQKFVRRHSRHSTARMALQRSRYRLAPLDYDDLRAVVDDWVDAAMSLKKSDLSIMEQLLRMQNAGNAVTTTDSGTRGDLFGNDRA